MITCPKCSKENQDHYKFCLGCGAELPRGAAPKPFSPQTPPHGVAAQAPRAATPTPAAAPAPRSAAAPAPAPAPVPVAVPVTPAATPAPAPAAAGDIVTCPQCGHKNPPNNRFCASCGYNVGALSGSVPAPAAAAAAPAAAAGGGPSVVFTALRADGTEAGTYKLPDAPTVTCGRDTGSIFAGDSYLSPRHATFTRRNNQLFVKDENSLNGVYLKIKPNEPWALAYNDIFRIGQEIVRLEELKPAAPSPDGVERFGSPAKGYIGRLSLVIGRDTSGNAFPIPERGVHLGRERGDILFSEDGYVSGLHCRIARGADGKMYLTDVGSSNGTFVRLGHEQQVQRGDILLMGQQLFRVDF
ncbi:MAG: FHA domain-containing protein [Polyangiaceae bacterium]|nr:FHA domain-containing protein [Polyangiaceae bacterium]MCL4751687.1 FHA domain-containing protein [Myxococcales bacterium]